jgi:glycosyltransferase involved in cell wall biosynthesis
MTLPGEAAEASLTTRLTGVSVIIPAYNYAQYLPMAIDSALGQSCQSLEVIVVDDGSTDQTRAVVAAYGDRVRYIYQANAGLSAARNTGIQNATHPFLILLDADDQLLPERAASGLRQFDQLPSAFGVVACLAKKVDGAGRELPQNPGHHELTGELTAADMLLRTRFSPSAAMVRREVFARCGMFDPALRSSEDRDMWIRAAQGWRIFLQSERLALIRKHDTNMSSHADRMKANMGVVISKCWRQGVVPRYRLDFWLQVQAIYHYQTALIYLGLRRRAAALRDILLALCFWPLPVAGARIGAAVSMVRLRTLWHALFDRFPASPKSVAP